MSTLFTNVRKNTNDTTLSTLHDEFKYHTRNKADVTVVTRQQQGAIKETIQEN